MKKPTYENIKLTKQFIPNLFPIEFLNMQDSTKLLNRDIGDELVFEKTFHSYEIIFNLGLHYDRYNYKYSYLLLTKKVTKEISGVDIDSKEEFKVLCLKLRYLPILSPGLIIEQKATGNYGKCYDEKLEITFDTKNVKYGTYKDLNLLDKLSKEIPNEFLDGIKDAYCGIVKPVNEQKTFIFPSFVIGSATYFHHQFLAQAALEGNLKLFRHLYDQRYHRRPMQWLEYAKEKYNYVLPDKFYQEDEFANREFHQIFKRLRKEREEKLFQRGSNTLNPLIRFPFAPNQEKKYLIYGIPLDNDYFLVHEISEYNTSKENRVYTGILTVKQHTEYIDELWKKDKEMRQSLEFRAKVKAKEQMKQEKDWEQNQNKLDKKGYGKFDL